MIKEGFVEERGSRDQQVSCYHCGDICLNFSVQSHDKYFCCQGCKSVYEILNQVDLCDYYTLQQAPGISPKKDYRKDQFLFLDDEKVQEKLLKFKGDKLCSVTLYLPQIHCVSCIWLLENLQKINPAIEKSSVHFLKKEITIVYRHTEVFLSEIAGILTSIGYEPHFSLKDLHAKDVRNYPKSVLYKIGIVGFCFANIMLLSFPEYFSSGDIEEHVLQRTFSWISLILSIPVFFYGASDFFISAWKGFQNKMLHIDAPIALSILITFSRSVYEVITSTGAGYFDSMSGIVFFMLIGRFFQNKTYHVLSFDRDYTSYFPMGVCKISDSGKEVQVPLSNIMVGDKIKIFSHEMIPVDGLMIKGKGLVDYSFVTGESEGVQKQIGEMVYAGGRQVGASIEMLVVKEVSQSYLTQLWNDHAFQKQVKEENSYIHQVSKYFSLALFLVALSAGIYWSIYNPSYVWPSVTAVLIVACPCALLLSATFTNGNMLRVFQKHQFFARSADVIESMSKVDTLVFDKTGTLTQAGDVDVSYVGRPLNKDEQMLVKSMVQHSSHPLSRILFDFYQDQGVIFIAKFQEIPGQGLQAIYQELEVKLGSEHFVSAKKSENEERASRVYIKIGEEIRGCFEFKTIYRPRFRELLQSLQKEFNIHVLSGDNTKEEAYLRTIIHQDNLHFNQTPQDKLFFIKKLQQQGFRVAMIGDGLNDAGALKQSDVGLVITEDMNNFSPACDVIIDSRRFGSIKSFFNYARWNKKIINASFMISILYNFIGLSFAVQGNLSPLIAAILMPISSISIIFFTTAMSSIVSIPLGREKIYDIDHINN